MNEAKERELVETVGRAKNSFQRNFILSAGAILAVTGAAKVWSGLGTAKVLGAADPIVGIQFGHLMLVVGITEIVVALLCFFTKRHKLALGLVAKTVCLSYPVSTLAIIVCFFSRTALMSAEVVMDGNVEQLKAFITNCSPIEIAVVRSRNSSVSGNWEPNKTPLTSPPFLIYQGARREDSFYVRQLLVDNDENAFFDTNTIIAVGRSEAVAWNTAPATVTGDTFYITKTGFHSNEITSFPHGQTTNSIIDSIAVYNIIFNRFLDFGLIDIKCGTFKFDGNEFKVKLKRGAEADGSLLLKNGQIAGIRFHILGDKPYIISEFEYSSNSLVPTFMPTKIIQKVYDASGNLIRTNMEFELLRLKVAAQPLAREYFLPDRFCPTSKPAFKLVNFVLTNGTLFQSLPHGGSLPVTNSHPTNSSRRAAQVLILLGLISGFPALLILYRSQSNKHQTVTTTTNIKKHDN